MSLIIHECARGELTYPEIAVLSKGLITGQYLDGTPASGLSAGYIGVLARKARIVRHRNPTIHQGKRFRTLRSV